MHSALIYTRFFFDRYTAKLAASSGFEARKRNFDFSGFNFSASSVKKRVSFYRFPSRAAKQWIPRISLGPSSFTFVTAFTPPFNRKRRPPRMTPALPIDEILMVMPTLPTWTFFFRTGGDRTWCLSWEQADAYARVVPRKQRRSLFRRFERFGKRLCASLDKYQRQWL